MTTPSPTTAANAPQTKLLLAWGDDRPGILDEVAHYLYERGANISDSKLLSARGTFILMIVVSGDAGGFDRIADGLAALASAARVRLELRDARPEGHGDAGFSYKFTASGSDQAGVLHKLGHLLRALNVNIEDVHTRVGTVSESAAARPQFELELLLSVPRATPVIKLREYLDTLCGELGMKWDLVPA
jgi:glycine cleavage system transcriptional repressor